MPAATLFIADLHLDPARPATIERFLRFLDGGLAGAEALYILGDLFEVWVGDDDDTPAYGEVVAALRAASTATPLFVLPGNRDFLLGAGFAAASGCRLLADPTLITLHGTPTLLCHGDTLCTDDDAYQAFRAQVRNEAWQATFLAKPLAERKRIAEGLRRQSKEAISAKDERSMDANPAAVAAAMRAHGAWRLIHGHTHRAGLHTLESGGERCVVGDWDRGGSLLRCTPHGCELGEVA